MGLFRPDLDSVFQAEVKLSTQKQLPRLAQISPLLNFINLFNFTNFSFSFSREQALIVLQQDQSKNNYLFRLLSITLYSNLQLYTLCVLTVCPFAKIRRSENPYYQSCLFLSMCFIFFHSFHLSSCSFVSFYLSYSCSCYLLYNKFFSTIYFIFSVCFCCLFVII